jgi:hypothetical protein
MILGYPIEWRHNVVPVTAQPYRGVTA